MFSSLIVFTLASAAAPATPAASPRKGLDPNRVICRTEEVTGSHLNTERRCMPAYQWKEYDRAQRESVDRTQRASIPGKMGG